MKPGPEGGSEHRAEAAVDVAAAEGVDRLVAGDRVEADAAEVPAQARAAAPAGRGPGSCAVDRDLVALEAVDEVVAARAG